jgi:hypothetical protein
VAFAPLAFLPVLFVWCWLPFTYVGKGRTGHILTIGQAVLSALVIILAFLLGGYEGGGVLALVTFGPGGATALLSVLLRYGLRSKRQKGERRSGL